MKRIGFIFPFVALFVYLYTKENLSETAIILAICVIIPSVFLYLLYPKQNIKKLTAENVEHEAFISYEKKSVDEIFDVLRMSITDAQEQLSILYYLRKKVHGDSNAAVELIHLGAFQQTVQILQNSAILDTKFLAAIDLLNEILHIQKAREELIINEYIMKECVDSVMEIFSDVINQTNTLYAVDTFSVQNSTEFTTINNADIEERKNKFNQSGYKILMTIGLLYSDNNHKLQSRIADKNGIQNIINYSFQNRLYLATNTDTKNTTTTAINTANNMLMIKYNQWGMWSLFNILINHPANKSEFYHLGGIRNVIDILRRVGDDNIKENNKNNSASPKNLKDTKAAFNNNKNKNIELYRQGLAVLLIMLTNDTYAKYSLTQARQMAMANNIVDVIQNIQNECKNNKSCADVVATSKAILNLIIQDWS